MEKLIITCAITGAETTRASQPNLPITPVEQGIASEKAIEAGASVIHLHVREENGSPSQRIDLFQETIAEIKRRVPEAIIQISTGGAVGDPIEQRLAPLRARPEMASLNLGTLNFGEDVFMNHPKDIELLAAGMKEHGIVPELEIYEMGMLESIGRYAKKGLIAPPYHCQFVLGVPGGMSGDVRNLIHLVNGLPESAHWGVAGVGRFQLPLATHAILLGGHVRVGFEDNIYYRKGELATSNAQLVERIRRLADELGRPVASPAEARAIIGVRNP